LKKKDKFAAVDAALDMRVFRTSVAPPDEPLKPHKSSYKSHNVELTYPLGLSVRDQSTLFALLYLAAKYRKIDEQFGQEIVFKTTYSEISQESGYKSATTEVVKESIQRLQATSYKRTKDPERDALPLIEMDEEQHIKIHPRLSRSIDSLISKKDKAKHPYFRIELDERKELMTGKHSAQATLIHAWFSSTVQQKKLSYFTNISTLLERVSSIAEIKSDSLTQKRYRCKQALLRMEDIDWAVFEETGLEDKKVSVMRVPKVVPSKLKRLSFDTWSKLN